MFSRKKAAIDFEVVPQVSSF
uniref:Uncharacterized protein n=1 Tax=Rhizophora mucronata TaxID=61149 RepID=A0A2P2PK43_RHIMU